MDGAVLVNHLRSHGCKIFCDHASDVFIPRVRREHIVIRRVPVDIVWVQYFDNSLKGQRPEKSVLVAKSSKTRDSPLPKNWQQFLRVNMQQQQRQTV